MGLTLMADITTEGDLGVVSASERSGDLARAIVAALARTDDDPGWPARIGKTATDPLQLAGGGGGLSRGRPTRRWVTGSKVDVEADELGCLGLPVPAFVGRPKTASAEVRPCRRVERQDPSDGGRDRVGIGRIADRTKGRPDRR